MNYLKHIVYSKKTIKTQPATMPKFEFSEASITRRFYDNSRGKDGFVICDVESIYKFASHNIEIMTNFLVDCESSNMVPVLVGKCSHFARLQAKFPGVNFNENIIYFFLHGGVGRCPDDAFIHELYAYLKKSGLRTYICSNDKYSNKKSWTEGETKVYKTMISHNNKPTRPRDHNDPKIDFYKPHDKTIRETVISTDDEFPFRFVKKEIVSLADMIAATGIHATPAFTFSMFGGGASASVNGGASVSASVSGGASVSASASAPVGSVGYFTPAGKRKLDAMAAAGSPILMAPEGADKKAKMHID